MLEVGAGGRGGLGFDPVAIDGLGFDPVAIDGLGIDGLRQ